MWKESVIRQGFYDNYQTNVRLVFWLAVKTYRMASKRSGLVSIVEDFSLETHAHALPRVGDKSRKIVARIIWAIMFLVATGFCTYQIYDLLRQFLAYPKNVEIKLEFGALPFPAVTICNVNPLVNEKIVQVKSCCCLQPKKA